MQNIEAYFRKQGLPAYRLYSSTAKSEGKPDILCELKESNSVESGWQHLQEHLLMMEKGIFFLVLAPSFKPGDTLYQHRMTISTYEASQAQPAQPAQPQPDMYGIYGTGGIGQVIQMHVDNALLRKEVEDLKRGEQISAASKAWLEMAKALSPHLPAVISAISGNRAQLPAAPKSKPIAKAQQPAHKPAQQAAYDDDQPTDEQLAIASSLEQIHSNGGHTARYLNAVATITANLGEESLEALEKLAAKSEENPEGLKSALPLLDTL